jgi:CBS domain-containing protein
MNTQFRICSLCPQPCRPAAWDRTDMTNNRQSAIKFIDRFGTRAALEAARRADELGDAGDVQARVRWQLIDREINSIFSRNMPAAALPQLHPMGRDPVVPGPGQHKEMRMFAHDIMTTNVITVRPEQSVAALAKLLIDRGISAVLVVNAEDRILGIVSEGDLVHRVIGDNEAPRPWWLTILGDPNDVPDEYAKLHGTTAADVMTRDVITVPSFTPLASIAERLEGSHINRVLIVDEGKMVGIVSRADVIQAPIAGPTANPAAKSDREIRRDLLDEFANHAWSNAATFNVAVDDGVVHYWGFVESAGAREAMRIAAENMAGVKSVRSNLDVAARSLEYI